MFRFIRSLHRAASPCRPVTCLDMALVRLVIGTHADLVRHQIGVLFRGVREHRPNRVQVAESVFAVRRNVMTLISWAIPKQRHSHAKPASR
jgi:hypothetical protein